MFCFSLFLWFVYNIHISEIGFTYYVHIIAKYFMSNDKSISKIPKKQGKKLSQAVALRCFLKKVFLKMSQFHRKTPVLEPQACNFIKKETPTQMFSWEI